MRLFIWSAWLSVAVAGMAGCRGAGAPRFVRGVLATPVVRVPIELSAGEELEIEARDARGGALPVLHLWDPATAHELARARLLGRSARLQFRNDSSETRRLELLVRSDRAGAGGQVDVFRDGQALLRAASLGGALLKLVAGSGIDYLVAATPDASTSAGLWGLDAEGGIVAYAANGGPTGLPLLAASTAITTLLLAADGHFNVYANDADDRDGDGVGRRLERALRTCEPEACQHSALADFYRAVGTRDSDRDGLSDADELFGANAAGLDFPRYGADPRHKDVFVEVDHDKHLASVGFSEREWSEIAALYSVGSAADLKNPDGLPGLRLHFDVGFAPSDPAHAGLFGDWGGSGRAQAAEYRAARKQDFSPARAGYFRYAFSTRRGRGQARGDAFTVNRDLLHRTHIFAHELGHTLGLQHYGHDSWGKQNCKPNYFSIMNYLYQNHDEAGFSRGSTGLLDPASARERGALPPWQPAKMLRASPLELDVFGRDVDWNRDGTIEDGNVRANLLWATYKSCGAAEHGLTTLSAEHVGATTPVLLESGHQLLALWLDDTGQLWLRRRQQQTGASWSDAVSVSGLTGLRQIAGATLGQERSALAYVAQDESLHLATLSFEGQGEGLLSDVVIPGAQTRDAPALALFELAEARYGAKRALGVLYRSASSGQLEQAFTHAQTWIRSAALDIAGHEIAGTGGPALSVLPSGERCAAFPNSQANIRFYCYDSASDLWQDLSARAFDVELGPATTGAPSLAYHRFRDASGAAIDSRGALYLVFSEPENNPHFYVSEWLSSAHGAREQISFRWRGRIINEWTQLAANSGVALLEGEQHLQALLVQRAGGALRLDYLPYADGEVDTTLDSGNDFQVMERGLCLGLRSAAECGDASTAAY